MIASIREAEVRRSRERERVGPERHPLDEPAAMIQPARASAHFEKPQLAHARCDENVGSLDARRYLQSSLGGYRAGG
jgi:hypothetical protein